jgi:hypothetical protein
MGHLRRFRPHLTMSALTPMTTKPATVTTVERAMPVAVTPSMSGTRDPTREFVASLTEFIVVDGGGNPPSGDRQQKARQRDADEKH